MNGNDVHQEIQTLTIALIGNPNSGKSSVFNQLTGLQQKVGNFPGVTVDKKTGNIDLNGGTDTIVVDFPGTYSFYPTSKDERIVAQTFANPGDPNYPDAIIYIADVNKLEKHLLLFSQVRDLGIPVVLALNMSDVAHREGIQLNRRQLAKDLGVPVICVSGRTGQGIAELKEAVSGVLNGNSSELPKGKSLYQLSEKEALIAKRVRDFLPVQHDYQAVLIAHHYQWLPFLNESQRQRIEAIVRENDFRDLRAQVEETMQRFNRFTPIVQNNLRRDGEKRSPFTERLDTVLTNRVAGPIIFFLLMLLVFQAIFAWATVPMDLIEGFFELVGNTVKDVLPAGWLADLITDGILAGLGGILVFIPQIAILFFLITLMEEIGYMARAAFIFDRLMQFFGLNGRSIIALISGGACAIPAIMSTRTIANWKERLITIMVTPLISCSARIPVYTVLIGFIVPSVTVWGIFNLQGLAFMALYLLGIIAALGAAYVFKLILKSGESSYLMLELPEYRPPVMRNVWLTVWGKVKTFVVEAGKIIMIISLVLWVLAYFGPPREMNNARTEALATAQQRELSEEETANLIAARQIEASYAGHLGHLIEPAIEPLGFDWKIGIALITSFAAREVFVGTMATIYSIGSADDEFSVRDRLARERDPTTGDRVYDLATSLSLLIFYVLAMQCMSTLAVVKRETKSWKWPIVQFVFMSAMAYLGSLIVYQIMG
jgi:ferrous iron transport protein B